MTPTTHRPGIPRGFSLIEILVILAVIAILGGISGLALSRWLPQANLKRATRTIVTMCQDARVEAIKRNAPVSVNCTQNLCISYLDNGAQFRRFDLSELRSNVQLTGAFNTIFTSRGRSSPSGSMTVQNSAGTSMIITIRPSGSIVTN